MGISRGARTAFPAHATVPGLFAEQVRARPDAVAVVDGTSSLTYAELDEVSTRVAHWLRRRGVTAETRVGVRLQRGHRLVTALLGVLKAGGAYVPAGPGQPEERQRVMSADAGVSVVLSDEEMRAATATPPSGAPPAMGADPHGLAYVLFTSGSTGRPKGVMVEHRSVVHLVRGTDYIDFGPGLRLAQLADPSFDAFTFEVWGALLNGGTLCVLPTEAALTPGGLARELAAHRVTTLFLTSALFAEVMADGPDSFAGLENLLTGGDVVGVLAARRLADSEPPVRPVRFLNCYGPTEATTFAVCGPIGPLPADALSVPIGRPLANTSCYVLGPDLKPVPEGAAGELYISGPGVARGYTGQPGETARCFLPDPFAPRTGARMYRTGDVVRARADDTLDFVGRVDDQVKIRGYRVEPGEVEAVLGGHPGVRQVAVTVDGAAGARRLVAHVVAASAGTTPAALRAFLTGRLPEWMIPAAFVLREASLPLTAGGKVDRAALSAEPVVVADGPADAVVAPRTDLEHRLTELVAHLLGVASLGVTDDFFALGGNSLLAMRLVSKVNHAFAAQVELGDFLYDPTIVRLAAEVSHGG